MSKKIRIFPNEMIYYIIDSNFFANKYLKPIESSNLLDRDRIINSLLWWEVIDEQVRRKLAILYINDLCISETFKVIAKKYYREKLLTSNRYQKIRNNITKDIHLETKEIISKYRNIKYHNLLIDRDIIIGASRYLEIANRHKLETMSIVDLIILSSAKHLVDFFKIKKEQIFILTGDRKIIDCSRFSKDGTVVIDPLNPKNTTEKYFY